MAEHPPPDAVTEAAEVASVRPREPVPTPRELSRGAERVEYVFEDAEVSSDDQPPRTGLRDLFADLHPRAISGPKAPLVLLGLAALFSRWDNQALGLLLPEMRAEFGISLAFLVTIQSVFLIFKELLAPPMGYLADRIKRVWMIRVGGVLSNLGSVFTGLAPGIPALAGARVMGGTGEAITEPAGFPLLTDYYPLRSRARVFALLAFAGAVGGLIGPSVAGFMGRAFGWRPTLVALGSLATFVTLGFFFLREPPRGYQDRREMGASEEVATAEQEPVSWSEAWRASASITTLRRLWYATPFLTVAAIGLGTFVQLYYAQEFGLDPAQRGVIGTATGVVALLALPIAGPLADRLLADRPGRVMVYLGALLSMYAVVVLVLVVSRSLWVSIVVSLPLGFGFAAIFPAINTLVSLVVPARIRGLGLQTVAPWRILGAVLGVWVAGFADSWGLRQGMLAFIPLLLLGTAILASSASGVKRDIRAATAVAMADEEARRARASGRNKMLICRDVDVTYQGTQVLFGVDFDVEEGETVALLGTNGSGKSTLLRAISGVQEASNGAIFLDGQDITHVPPHENARRGIVMVPGGHAVFPDLTVEENLRTAVWMYRRDEAYVEQRMAEVLSLFPALAERLYESAGVMSGGEQQMLAVGQAFLMRPRLLMIDELSLGLAPAIVEQLTETLRKIHEQGTTIVVVEQSLNVAATFARRAVFLEKGEVRFDGPLEDLIRRPELVRSVFMSGAVSGGRARARHRHVADADRRLLEVTDAHVRFGGVQALDGVGVHVGPGQIVGIIGANGAGKTTLFDAISGYVQLDKGQVLIDGANVTSLPPSSRARLGLGRSFQNVRLFGSLTVRETIAVALERHLESRSALLAALWSPQTRSIERRVARKVEDLIDLLGLGAYADKFIDELSTGTRRTVDIACVMASEPQVLLLDEPSSGLAQAETEELGPVITRLARETGAGIVVIEHDIPLVSTVSGRLLALELGQILAEGEPDAVLQDAAVQASYLAASSEVVARSDIRPRKEQRT